MTLLSWFYSKGSETRTWFPWLALALVVALVLAYVMTYCSSRHILERFEAKPVSSANKETSRCLTRPILKRYTDAATDFEKALKTVIDTCDAYSNKYGAVDSDKTSSTDANATDADKTSTADTDATNSPILADTDNTNADAADNGLGFGEFPATEGNMSAMSPPNTSLEGFVAKDACLHDPKDIKLATTQYKERPLALMKLYNELRSRVDKGIQGIERIRKMKNKTKEQEKKHKQQTKSTQQESQAINAETNKYYGLEQPK